MNKTQLREIIKEEIQTVLSEEINEPVLEDDLDQLTLLLKAFAELPEGAKNAVYDLSATKYYMGRSGDPDYDAGSYNYRDVAIAYDALMPILRGGISELDIRGLMQTLHFGKKEFLSENKKSKSQPRRITKEAFDNYGMSEYGLYGDPSTPKSAEAETEFDELFDEVALFLADARKRMNALILKHDDLGSGDAEAIDAITAAFEAAKSGKRR